MWVVNQAPSHIKHTHTATGDIKGLALDPLNCTLQEHCTSSSDWNLYSSFARLFLLSLHNAYRP